MENNPTTMPGDTLGGVGASPPLGSQGGGTMNDLTQQAKETASQVGLQAKEKAGDLLNQARGQVTTQLDTQKNTAAESLGAIAEAIRGTGDQLRQQDQTAMASQLTDRAAGLIDNMSGYLREHSVEDLTYEIQDFARRQPGLFLGGAFALGFLAARFLRSSNTNGGSSRSQGGQSSGYASGYSQAYGGSTLPMHPSDLADSGQDVTAAGSIWTGEPTPDSPRGRPVHVSGSGSAGTSTGMAGSTATGLADETTDDYQLTGKTGE